MNKGQLEALIREEFIKLLKRYTGKGPREGTVKITKNFVVMEFKEVLTSFEKHLLANESGPRQVEELRKNLIKSASMDCVALLERLLDAKVIDGMFKLNVESDTHYGTAVFHENLEEKLENATGKKCINMQR